MPDLVIAGKMPSSQPLAFSWTPKHLGMEGPVISASKIAVLWSLLCIRTASIEVTEDFPTPPFPLTMPITFFTLLILFWGAIKLSGCLEGQSSPQVEQSWVQFSLMYSHPFSMGNRRRLLAFRFIQGLSRFRPFPPFSKGHHIPNHRVCQGAPRRPYFRLVKPLVMISLGRIRACIRFRFSSFLTLPQW